MAKRGAASAIGKTLGSLLSLSAVSAATFQQQFFSALSQPTSSLGRQSPTRALAPAQIANPWIIPTMGTASPITPRK
jgi:hypothetical protein